MKKILLIGAGMDAPDSVTRISEQHIRVVFIQKCALYREPQGKGAECVILTDYEDGDFLRLADSLHAFWHFDAVLSLTESGVEIAAKLNQAWGIVWTPIDTVAKLKDKYAMRMHLNRAGFSEVNCALCHTESDLINFADSNGFPFIVKPVDGAGSENVVKVDSAGKMNWLIDAWRSKCFTAIAESWIMGQEYSVETLSFSGEHHIVNITEKHVDDNFIEIGHVIPARVDQNLEEKIRLFVLDFLQLMGVTDGPCHTEIKVDGDVIKVIESHNRIGGDYIGLAIRQVYQLDMIALTARWACYRELPRLNEIKNHGCAVVQFFQFPAGSISSLSGIEKFKQQASTKLIDFNLKYVAGDTIVATSGNSSRAGHFMLFGCDATDTLDVSHRLKSFIQVSMTHP